MTSNPDFRLDRIAREQDAKRNRRRRRNETCRPRNRRRNRGNLGGFFFSFIFNTRSLFNLSDAPPPRQEIVLLESRNEPMAEIKADNGPHSLCQDRRGHGSG